MRQVTHLLASIVSDNCFNIIERYLARLERADASELPALATAARTGRGGPL